jgi:ferredoxin
MLRRLQKGVPRWLRTARWHASDTAWHANWRAIRAAATPWARPHYERARAKLFGAQDPAGRPATVISRERLDGWLRDAAPPGVPFDAVVLESSALRARFGEGPKERRSLHMHGKLRMTHRGHPEPGGGRARAVQRRRRRLLRREHGRRCRRRVNQTYGADVAFADTQASVPVLLKEVATAAGLGTIGKNALFFSRRFGFNCKLNVVFLNAPVDRYDPAPTADQWKLPDCSTCNLCVEACPVGAFDDYVITRTESCDRLIAGDFFGPRRDHMCRACITRCPVSLGAWCQTPRS